MGCVCEGSVVVAWMGKYRDGTCIQGFCSGGLGGGTWRWDVYVKVLWRWFGWRNIEIRRVCKGSVAMACVEEQGSEICI